jgi:putative endonuclease
MHYVYVLRSLKDKRTYVGSTADLEARIKEHNAGKVRSTKGRRPFILLYSEMVDTVTLARQRENFLKTGRGRQWMQNEIVKKTPVNGVETDSS